MTEVDPARSLAAHRAETLARLSAMTRDFDDLVAASRDSNADDEHDPEGSTIAFERAQLAGLLDDARQQLADLDAATARVADGSYGICLTCGRTIAPLRLEARPATCLCVRCAGLNPPRR